MLHIAQGCRCIGVTSYARTYIDAVRERRAHDTSEERAAVGNTNNNAFREWSQELNRPLQGAYPVPDSQWYNDGAVAETSKEVLGQYYNFAYELLWTPYCWYIDILGSGLDCYQTSAIAK